MKKHISLDKNTPFYQGNLHLNLTTAIVHRRPMSPLKMILQCTGLIFFLFKKKSISSLSPLKKSSCKIVQTNLLRMNREILNFHKVMSWPLCTSINSLFESLSIGTRRHNADVNYKTAIFVSWPRFFRTVSEMLIQSFLHNI